MNNEIKQAILLERYKSHLAKEFNLTVKDIERVLSDEILKQEIASLNQRQIESITLASQIKIQEIFNAYFSKLKIEWKKLFSNQLDWLKKITGLKMPKATVDYRIPLEISTGLSLDDVINRFTAEQAEKLAGAIRLAHHKGLTNQDLIKLIRGTRANRFNDGILSVSKRHAETIARTGTAIVANQAKQEFIQANRDDILGIRIIATLDTRTSPICRHLDHQFYFIDEAKYPPFHFNCRSAFQIVLKGDNSTITKRASMNGVVDNVSYYDWLKTQPAEIQDIALGKKRAELFRNGGMSIERFKQLQLDRNFEPLTLKEMEQLEPVIFARAFSPSSILEQKEYVLPFFGSEDFYHETVAKLTKKQSNKQLIDKYNLTSPEIAIVRAYTGNSHAVINEYLRLKRDESYSMYELVKNSSIVLSSALNKLPSYTGKVIRRTNLNSETLNHLLFNDIIQFDEYLSATKSTRDVHNDKPYRIIIHSKHGKLIDFLSGLPAEEEVLFDKGSRFKIISRQKGKKSVDDYEWLFELDEI